VVADVLLAVPRSRTSKLVVPVGDGDNYEKAIFDMIQKKGYLADDKWITTGHWRKRFIPHGYEGYTEIVLYEETEEIDIEPTD
jgi:Holliday junction resolvase RusA-like endonuclease